MDKPGVWVVDADHWPRAELRALLIERGYDAMGIATRVPVIAIGGAVEWEQTGVRGGAWAACLRRPVTLGDIADAVARAMPGP
jgi:hypothetical protein